jgi:hypothetical protein
VPIACYLCKTRADQSAILGADSNFVAYYNVKALDSDSALDVRDVRGMLLNT